MNGAYACALPLWAAVLFAATGSACDAKAGLHDSPLYAECYAGAAICVPKSLVDKEQRSLLERDSCTADMLCVPRSQARGAVAKTCTSLASAEGRCLFEQLPLIASQRERLPRSFCEDNERCAPCYDPLSGDSTGACALPGDPGPRQAPRVFDSCCGGEGRCLPPELLEDDQRKQLANETCERGEMCVPELLLDGALPERCESSGAVEGRCLPECLPVIAVQAEALPRSTCGDTQRCAPCFDPVSGEPTGACMSSAQDAPLSAAETFPSCCRDAGRCLPRELVPEDQQDALTDHDCESAQLCVPLTVIHETAPPSCSSVGGVEGRCLPECLPVIAQQLGRLPRASCAEGLRCAPCFDPFTGEASGACSLPGDPGPVSASSTFARCCGATGSCLPPELVEREQRTLLAADSCSELQLCVPQFLLDQRAPAVCKSTADFEGRCLSECLPLVAAQKQRLPRADCPHQQRCVPCADPLSGEDTGACTLPGDKGPKSPPGRFERCCADTGHCLPNELVPEAQRQQLAQLSCDSEQLCSPELLTREQAPVRCSSVAGAEGRCLSQCLPLVAAQMEQLPRSSCDDDQRCAPCFDPFSGAASGACSLPNDPGPTRSPLVFADCCQLDGAPRGRCVPRELVPSDKRSLLGAADCADDTLCLPANLTPPASQLPACEASAGAPGACAPLCLLSDLQASLTTQGTCQAWERCLPCTALGTPTGVCD